VIFSASSSGISHSNSSSSAITSSTVSSESAPRSSTNADSFLISDSFTPSCSATIFLTRCSMFSMERLLPCNIERCINEAPLFYQKHFVRLSRKASGHVHAAIDMPRRPGDVTCTRRNKEGDGRGNLLRLAQATQRNLPQQRV